MTTAPASDLVNQPVSAVEWVDRTRLSANSWNPNHQAPPEHRLLAVSILENGWTQPIVVREHDGGERLEIVDGYHRWLVSDQPEVFALTSGLVPIVRLPETDDVMARMTTIRHNRARGTHAVVPMADIVVELLDQGIPSEEIQRRLGMDDEEVDRLADRGVMIDRGSRPGFGKGWTV
jgi:ParB-like chromosome segregation protein Spo0J